MRSGSATSPIFIASIIFRSSAERSSSLMGPIRPALAREGDSERSAASFSKLSPASARARIASALALAASSAATLMPSGSAGGADEDLAQRDRGRRRELRQMRVVIGARFLFGHRHLVHDLVLLDPLPDHLRSQIPAQIGQRQPSCLSAASKCFLVLELVLGPDVLEDGRELRVAEGVAELLAALHDEHLVHASTRMAGVISIEHLSKLRVVRVALQIDLLTLHVAEPGDLPIFEVGFREDLAVHFDEDLLDDFAAQRRGACTEQPRR